MGRLERLDGIHWIQLVGRPERDVARSGQIISHRVNLTGHKADILRPLADFLDVVLRNYVMFHAI